MGECCSGLPDCLLQWMEDDSGGDCEHSPNGDCGGRPGQRHDWVQLPGALFNISLHTALRLHPPSCMVRTVWCHYIIRCEDIGDRCLSWHDAVQERVRREDKISIVCVQANELFSAANQTASEAFAAIRTVAAFSLQAPLGTLYEKLLEKPQASASFGF